MLNVLSTSICVNSFQENRNDGAGLANEDGIHWYWHIGMLDVSVLHFTDYFAILTKGIKRSPRYLDGFRDLRITKRSPWGQGPNNLARGPRHFRVRGPPIRCILLCMSVLTIEANFLELLFGKLPTVIHLLMEIFLLLLHPLAQIVALRLRYQLWGLILTMKPKS